MCTLRLSYMMVLNLQIKYLDICGNAQVGRGTLTRLCIVKMYFPHLYTQN